MKMRKVLALGNLNLQFFSKFIGTIENKLISLWITYWVDTSTIALICVPRQWIKHFQKNHEDIKRGKAFFFLVR